ncbi:mucin-5AC [Bombyx mandarina]|uniref:Mucin-5AC n=1 Tax=Bombyx mandarina TaxID=7092 RepID=A0A6J2K2U0_BOMMA|nr:mucin-5AC [Bombyx mandarina]
MGIFDYKFIGKLFKMESTIWLTLLLAVIATTPVSSNEPRVVCYYTNWSVYRPGTAKFNPQNINPYLCTHLIYAFGGFTKDNTLKPFDKYQDIEKGGYAKFTGLKTYNKNLKTLLAIGGWNEGSSRFSPMVASKERRKEFVRNAIKFLRQNRFDGLDLDWEYPAFRDGSKPKDRENYSRLVRELREEFERESEKTGKPRLLLTMAVPAGIEYIQKGYDVKTLNRHLDWMNLLSYDYHSAFEPAVNHHAPLYPLEEPNEYSVDTELNIDYTIKFYLENGADRNKLVLGIPTYGRSYTLFNTEAVEIGSPADGPGEQGDATREKGYLAYYEICEALKPKSKKRAIDSDEEYSEEEEEQEDEEWTVMHPNPNAMGPIAFKGNQWVGYDDIDIVRKKAEYVAENGLGGIMFWSIDNDDFRGTCHSKPYPLIEAAKEAYIQKLESSDNVIITEKPSSVSRTSNRRKNRPKTIKTTTTTTTTTEKPTTTRSNKRKSSSTTPAWGLVTPSPPTTPDPGSDFKCVDEGFFPHPRDCKKYFWCLDSGPSDLGIVAHQFTCPSGLYFNKAADSCDFARNVLCKTATTTKAPTTRAPTTKPPTTKTTVTTTTTTTTRKPIKISTRNSLLFRTTTTTTPAPEPESDEEYQDEVSEDTFDDAEDPKVIKELIDLIKKVGGIEQLEKQLHLSEASASTDGASTTTPSSFNKKLYQKVLERTRGKNKYSQNSVFENNRRAPQSQGGELAADGDQLPRKDRPQYVTINRQRSSTSTTAEPESEYSEEEEEDEEEIPEPIRARPAESSGRVGTTAKPLQYVNIRRGRPTAATSEPADDTASRNALFERQEPAVTSSPSKLDVLNARKENLPEYVTMRRQRPTTEETTTVQYQAEESEEDSRQTALEREISSQPQYNSIIRTRSTTFAPVEESTSPIPFTSRARSTTLPPVEEPSSPEPTTVLTVQISSLINSLNSEIDYPVPETTLAQATEPAEAPTTTSTTVTTTTTTTTTAAPSSIPPRRTVLRRRGSTSTTTTTTTASTPVSSTQVSPRNYAFRRRRPLASQNEISSETEEDVLLSRKIRSTTPDSREVDRAKANRETGRRYRSRFQARALQNEDSIPAAASPVSSINTDEVASLTPVDIETQVEPRKSFTPRFERRFRGRTTVAEAIADSEASAATVEVRRPDFASRGRSRFTLNSTTEPASQASATSSTAGQRRPTFGRLTPRPFARTTSTTVTPDDDYNDEVEPVTSKTPSRLAFGRNRPSAIPRTPLIQARKLPFPTRQSTTQKPIDKENEDYDETETKNDDITLSETTIEEKEVNEENTEETPIRRVIIKKVKTPGSTDNSEAIPVDESGRKRFRIIRRKPIATTTTPEIDEVITSTAAIPRIRKIIRKKIKPVEKEPKIATTASIDDHTPEPLVNYGEKTKATTESAFTNSPTKLETEGTPEPITLTVNDEQINRNEDTENLKDDEKELKTEIVKTNDTPQEIPRKPETTTIKPENKEQDENSTNDYEKALEITSTTPTVPAAETKLDETEQTSLYISGNETISVDATTIASSDLLVDSITTVSEENLPETTTTSTTLSTPSSSIRTRLPYRPPKRLFTSTTAAATIASSRIFSRKYNPGVYTSPSTIEREPFRPSGRRPFSSKVFTRKPFTTVSTTPKEEEYEEEYTDDEELLEEEPENPFAFVPSSQLFTRKPEEDEEETLDEEDESEEILDEEEDVDEAKPVNVFSSTTKRTPFKPRLINSNTFRTTTSTTELPRPSLFGSSQNRSGVFTRFGSPKPSNDTKKRVQNVPIGYNSPVSSPKPSIEVAPKNENQPSTELSQDINTTTISSITETDFTTDIDDDYLSATETANTTSDLNRFSDLVTNVMENETTTQLMEVMTDTDDYLEDTTIIQTTVPETTITTQTGPVYEPPVLTSTAKSTTLSTTSEMTPETASTAAPIVKTQFDKLFSISRVVEVSSKLDKHRVNKNNETTRIEEGKIVVEKQPVVDKIGEVSRFSLIKIVEDEIPIYLTRLGHVYPVANPPDNPIRIDEARNARALNYFEIPRENLVASESINEAYRHNKDITDKDRVEHLQQDDFLSYVNEDKNDDKEQDETYTQWQFVPAAYETEKQKTAKNFEIVTPRSMHTYPSTLPLEGLFKTETPTARKVINDPNQPFVVYSAPAATEEDTVNIVKLKVLKPETGRSIITFAKGQQFSGAPTTEESTVKYPINISILPSPEVSTTPADVSTTSTTTESVERLITTSPLIDLLVTQMVTEATTTTTAPPSTIVSTTDATSATETITEETTTSSAVDIKKGKFAFPRRPIIKPLNFTRPAPRSTKKVNATQSDNSIQKTNKTATFTPLKSRFSSSRKQNVPIDVKKKTGDIKPTTRSYTTETPRATTERRVFIKSLRPGFQRPAFVPRKTTATTQSSGDT